MNPDAALARVAREEGWEVLRFETLGRRLKIVGAVGVALRRRRDSAASRSRPARAPRRGAGSRAPSLPAGGLAGGEHPPRSSATSRADTADPPDRPGRTARIARTTPRHMAARGRPPPPATCERWERERYAASPERDDARSRRSPVSPITPLYTRGRPARRPDAAIGLPGESPFTRGVYPSMYRGRLWTMRQFAGFGTAEETNERFRYLLDHGQTGLSTAFDMPSLMGHDSDHARSSARSAARASAIDTVDDMETLFDGIPLGEVSVSMTINAPAADHARLLRRRRRAAGRRRRSALAGTIQTDILKEYIAQKEWCFPIDPAMRLVGDMIEWCSREMPRWHPVSISGYHIREAGSTAAQELAFTLKDGLTYVEQAVARGLDVDDFAPRLSLLLQRADRLLRGDREVPRRAPHLGAGAARDLRRARPALVADALPHADRRGVADRAAAAQQHRAHRDRGAGRRARRHAVAAHQQLRRGARARRPRRRCASRCAPSRSSPTRPAWPTRSTRSAAATSSRP